MAFLVEKGIVARAFFFGHPQSLDAGAFCGELVKISRSVSGKQMNIAGTSHARLVARVLRVFLTIRSKLG